MKILFNNKITKINFPFNWNVIVLFFILISAIKCDVAFANSDTLEVSLKKRSNEITKKSLNKINDFVQIIPADTNAQVIIQYNRPQCCVGNKKIEYFSRSVIIGEELVKKGIIQDRILIVHRYSNREEIKIFWRTKHEIANFATLPTKL